MIVIHRGNDVVLRLVVLRGDGSTEDWNNVRDVTVQYVLNGARWVVIDPTQVYVTMSGIEALLPADKQEQCGDYRAIVKYKRGGRQYLAESCHAFTLTECVGDATMSDAAVEDVTLCVQFSADGKDGLSGYELSLLNGYTGTYDEWVKLYTGLRTAQVSFYDITGAEVLTLDVAVPTSGGDSYGSSYAYEPIGEWDTITTSGEETTTSEEVVDNGEVGA